MATSIKLFVYIVVFIILMTAINKFVVMNLSDAVLRARVLRFQLTIAILCFLSALNMFVWRNLSRLFDRERPMDRESESAKWTTFVDFRQILNWRSYTLKALSWRVILGVIQISSICSYTSFSFLIFTEPVLLGYWLFLCFAIVVQLFCGLVFSKMFTFLLKCMFKHRMRPSDPKLKGTLIVLYAALIVSIGFYNISQPPKIKEVRIPIKDLNEEFNGYQITFVSDIHLGPTVGMKRLEGIVNMINYIQSDLVIIGGDLVDGKVEQLKEAVQPLDWIKAKHGVYFVTGNHEYYTSNAEEWLHQLSDLGVTTLHNNKVNIQQKDQVGFCLSGVDDPTADTYRYSGHGMDIDSALKSCDPQRPVILVAHQPSSAKTALNTNYRLDLVLSGHTHGGQMFPITIGAYLFNPFYAGLYRQPNGAHVYVSMGTMYWGFPVRFLTQSEITKIILHPA